MEWTSAGRRAERKGACEDEVTRVYAELEGGRCLLALDGHATGSPKVCAAISSIVYALAGYLTNAERDGRAEVYDLVLEEGRVRIHCHGDDRTTGACEMAVVGLRQLERQYPELLQVTFPPD